MKTRMVEYYAEGQKIVGAVHLPDDYQEGTKLPCIIPCSGFTGIRPLYPDMFSRYFTKYGYACLAFDFRHWAPSEGEVGYTTNESELEDILASIVFAQQQPEIDPYAIGLFGWGMAAPLCIKAAVEVPEIRAVACGNGYYNYENMIKCLHGNMHFQKRLKEAKEDRIKRVLTGKGDFVPFDYFAGGDAPEEVPVDGYLKEGGTFAQMANAKELNEAVEKYYGGLANFPPKTSWAFFDSSMRMRAEEFVQRLAPRGLFLIGSLHDTAYNYEETVKIYNAAGPGKVLYTIDGYHNNWMIDGHPELEKAIENMVAFYDSYMK